MTMADAARPLSVLHRDPWLLAVCKPAGLLMHRSALDAHEQDDLVGRLRQQLGAAVWPLHRLDKGTSGVVLLARDAVTASRLGEAFANGQVDKRYLALVRGWPAHSGEVDQALARDPEQPSAGQPRLPAVTRWQVLRRHVLPLRTRPGFEATRVALLSLQPLTGRRHQIRRHMKHIGHPLIGDATHGKGPLNRALAEHLGIARLWLHAAQIALAHPVTGEALTVRAPTDAAWQPWLAEVAAPDSSVPAQPSSLVS